MKTQTLKPPTEGAIWRRIVDPSTGNLTPAAADTLLLLDFHASDRAHMEELAQKARDGTLTPQERQAAETYNRVAHLLALLQSKARRSFQAGRKNR